MNLDALRERVDARAAASPEESYTARLLAEGVERCAKKFGEEAIELALASMGRKKKQIVAETADVLYHLLVLLKCTDVKLEAVMNELDKRTAQSGIEEKAKRKYRII